MTPMMGTPVCLLNTPINTVTHFKPESGMGSEILFPPLMYSAVESIRSKISIEFKQVYKDLKNEIKN